MRASSILLFVVGVASLLYVSGYTPFSHAARTVPKDSAFSPLAKVQSVILKGDAIAYGLHRREEQDQWDLRHGNATIPLSSSESARIKNFLEHVVLHYTDSVDAAPDVVEQHLKDPALEIRARYRDGSEQTIIAGGEAYFKNSLYARSSHDKKIGFLSNDVLTSLQEFMPRILNVQPFEDISLDTMRDVRISSAQSSYHLKKKEGAWALASNERLPLSEKKVQSFVSYFKTFSLSSVLWTEEAETIEVDGSVCVDALPCIEIVSYDRVSALRYAGAAYVYGIDFKKHPLPAFYQEQFIEQTPFGKLPAISSMELSYQQGTPFIIQRRDNDWYLGDDLADTRFVNGWIIKLHTLHAIQYAAEGKNYVKGAALQSIRLNNSIDISFHAVQPLTKEDRRAGLVECSLPVCPFFIDSIQLRRVRAVRDMFVLPEEEPEPIAIHD